MAIVRYSVCVRRLKWFWLSIAAFTRMDRIGKYDILHELGQGGMGIVYKARDPVIGRDVAIKVIQERILHAPKLKKRFYREARSAGRLSHPHITTLYDIGEDDGTPYLVMEFLGGTDLGTLLQRQHSFTLEEKIDIACQIAEGLQYAHQNSVIHRDIKPDNIRILAKNRVKIMDFGIARLDEDTQTLTKESIGTPRYMSPEQIRGDAVDARTDIFSFGVLLYEFLTGTSPFQGERVTTVIYKILHEDPPPIELGDTPLAGPLQQIVSRCLAKDPDARYADFRAVRRELSALVRPPTSPTLTSGLGAAAPSAPSRVSASSGSAPTNRRRVALIGLVVLLAAAAGSYAIFGPPTALFSSPTDPPTTQQTPPVTPEDPPPEDALAAAPVTEDDSGRALPSDPVTPPDDVPEATLPTDSIQPAQEDIAAPPEPSPEATATNPEPAALSLAADSARRAMEQARSAVIDQRERPTVAPLFEQAEERSAQARGRYQTSDFAAAVQAFQEAEALYAQIGQALANERTAAQRLEAQRRTAEAARARMQNARAAVDAERRHHTPFQQAEARAAEGAQAVNRSAFTEAAPLFDEATALYEQAAVLPTRTEEVQQRLSALVAQCQSAFEREDLDALRGLSAFYGDWANFFALADDITAELTPDEFRLTNSRATASIRFRLEYKDNKNRTQRTQFTHSWTLTQRGQSWVLSDVTAQ